jgi:membrane-bound ClpP family serine protease
MAINMPHELVCDFIFGAWCLSLVAFGFGAVGLVWDRRVGLALLGTFLSTVEIVMVHC